MGQMGYSYETLLFPALNKIQYLSVFSLTRGNWVVD